MHAFSSKPFASLRRQLMFGSFSTYTRLNSNILLRQVVQLLYLVIYTTEVMFIVEIPNQGQLKFMQIKSKFHNLTLIEDTRVQNETPKFKFSDINTDVAFQLTFKRNIGKVKNK